MVRVIIDCINIMCNCSSNSGNNMGLDMLKVIANIEECEKHLKEEVKINE